MKALIPVSLALAITASSSAAPIMSKDEIRAWRCFSMKLFCKRQHKKCYIPVEKEKTYDIHSFLEQKPWMDKLDKHICNEVLAACKQIIRDCSKDKEDKE